MMRVRHSLATWQRRGDLQVKLEEIRPGFFPPEITVIFVGVFVRIFPERRVEGRFLGAVSLSSMT